MHELETLKLPACTRFGNYIVTGCSSLTRIEAAAAGDFVNIDDDTSNIGNTSVFQNRAAHSGANAFDPANCDLVLNADKKPDGTALPKVHNGNEWLGRGGQRLPHTMEEHQLCAAAIIRTFPEAELRVGRSSASAPPKFNFGNFNHNP